MTKRWPLLLLLLLPQFALAAPKPAVPAPAVSTSNEESPQLIAEAFFELLEQNKVEAAFDRLFANATLVKERPQSLTNLKKQTPELLAVHGELLGHEFLTEEGYGSSVVRLLYVVKSAKHPTIWQFFFYKPKDRWFLADLKFYDNFDLLLSIKASGN
jgi:hypothetical protein